MDSKVASKLGLDLFRIEPMPVLQTANGDQLSIAGLTEVKVTINNFAAKQTFIVSEELTVPIILGRDYLVTNRVSLDWSETGFKTIKADGQVIHKLPERIRPALYLQQAVRIPPGHVAMCPVETVAELKGEHCTIDNELLRESHPNLQHTSLWVDINKAPRTEEGKPVFPIPLFNCSAHETMYFPKGQVVAFAEPQAAKVNFIKQVASNTPSILEPVPMPRRTKSSSISNREKPVFASQHPGKDISGQSKSNTDLSKGPKQEKHSANLLSGPSVTPSGQLDDAKREDQPEGLLSGPSMFPATTSHAAKQEKQGERLLSGPSINGMTTEDMEFLNKQPGVVPIVISDFILSPAEIIEHRKVDLEDRDIKDSTKQAFAQLCERRDEVFSRDNKDIGKTHLTKMDIDTGEHNPVAQKPYTLALKHYDWVKKEIETLLDAGVIEASISPWASPIVVVPKKSSPGEPPRRRLCVDFRKLNSLQPKVDKAYSKAKGCLSLFPIPKIDELYARLNGSYVFSTLDLRSGYYHIALKDEAKAKTAFVTPFGKYQFNVTPFGLAQAPAYFQDLMQKVLVGLDFAMAYLDDIIIFSKTEEEHLKHLDIVFERLQQAHLKLKCSKCDFFKKHIQYLGHLVSAEGIKPLPEKLECVEKMPPPRNPKEIKQFLGLVGYYRKFVPRFSDIARPLSKLTRKDTNFIWSTECQEAFQMLKDALTKSPILIYPDPEKPYTLFTDASNYGHAGVLTQEKTTVSETGETVTMLHPVAYTSGLFRGSQLNWAALTKEAYAIYMSIKKLSFYLTNADIILRSDHKPLEKFLKKNTMNSKVNNWAVELETYRIDFVHIEGKKNLLADALSRLIQLDSTVELPNEKEGHEFGYACFEELPPVKVNAILDTYPTSIQFLHDPDLTAKGRVQFDIEAFKRAQCRDPHCVRIINLLSEGNEGVRRHYTIEDKTLKMRFGRFGGTVYVLPRSMITQVLQMAHDDLGHNGFQRTYKGIKQQVYWKGMKRDILNYCRSCPVCAEYNTNAAPYPSEPKHMDPGKAPMQFISMDLIGQIDPPSREGHKYCLTVICMLTGYTWCVPLKTKTASEVVDAYMNNVWAKFGGSDKILSDNGTEFKNKLVKDVCEILGTKQVFSAPYHPQSNGRIEGFHKFLKTCMSKEFSHTDDWLSIVDKATAAYNFMPNASCQESPFYLMFGRDPNIPLKKFIKFEPRWLGFDDGRPDLSRIQALWTIAAKQIKLAREKAGPTAKPARSINHTRRLQVGDAVLVKNFPHRGLQPRFIPGYRVTGFRGNRVQLLDPKGTSTEIFIGHVKKQHMAEQIADIYPDEQNLGRTAKLNINPAAIPDLDWNLGGLYDEKTVIQDPAPSQDSLKQEKHQDNTAGRTPVRPTDPVTPAKQAKQDKRQTSPALRSNLIPVTPAKQEKQGCSRKPTGMPHTHNQLETGETPDSVSNTATSKPVLPRRSARLEAKRQKASVNVITNHQSPSPGPIPLPPSRTWFSTVEKVPTLAVAKVHTPDLQPEPTTHKSTEYGHAPLQQKCIKLPTTVLFEFQL